MLTYKLTFTVVIIYKIDIKYDGFLSKKETHVRVIFI